MPAPFGSAANVARSFGKPTPAPRRFLTDKAAIDARMRQDIAELYGEHRCVGVADLIRRGWSRDQVRAWRAARPEECA